MNTLRHNRFALPASLLVLALVAPGCGKDATPATAPKAPASPAPLTAQSAGDLARIVGASLAGQGSVPFTRLGNSALSAAARGEAPELKTSRTGSLQDEGGSSWWFSVSWFDAAGNEQARFDSATTARMRALVRARGNLDAAGFHAAFGTARELDVTGLLPAETTIEIDGATDDTSRCSLASDDGTQLRRYDVVSDGRLVDVRQLKDETVNPYPLSGRAEWQVTAEALAVDGENRVEVRYQARVVITFNGTAHPTVVIDGTYRYRLNLDTGAIEPLPA
jgi:hypothetical protein